MFKLANIAAAAVVLYAALGAVAHAAIVVPLLEQDSAAGTWTLRLHASHGDNGGIAAYSIPLVGQITSLDHSSPRELVDNLAGTESHPVGFTLLRTADGISPASLKVGGSQDTITPTPFIIYGYGQQAGSLSEVTGRIIIDDVFWAATPVIATGTMQPGTRLTINRGSVDYLANVFIMAGSTQTMGATMAPEPSGFAMAACASLAAATVRRRSMLRFARKSGQ